MPRVDVDTVSVAEYATRIAVALRDVGGAVVEGEVQKPTRTDRGMLFFDVTDGDARLSCKVFPRDAGALQHQPRHGDLVQVTVDRPDFYAQQGRVSVIVSAIQLAGEGELLRRREELLRRLTSDGLCDPRGWKRLPRFPRAVGVIAGRGSDGLADVVRALADRWPPVHVVTCAARVQGVEAPGELVDALARMQGHPLVDVIVLARGGGSVQDLVAFDDERVCRAVHACAKPVVCAVGHTDNVPVCNHVTHHAPTPSRAPELTVPDAGELRAGLRLAAVRLAAAGGRVERCTDRVAAQAARLDVGRSIHSEANRVAAAAQSLAAGRLLDDRARAIAAARALLGAVPRRVPRVDALRALGASVDARARAFFAERSVALDGAGERLRGLAAALTARTDAVAGEGRRVAVATRRQLADHERDYGRALSRLGRESGRGAVRALGRCDDDLARFAPLLAERAGRALRDRARDHERRTRFVADAARALGRSLAGEARAVEREGGAVAELARRRLATAEQALRHVREVVGARDFRRRGWLLASDSRGQPLADACALAPRERLQLHFRDGDVTAVADTIDLKGDPG